jgi:hypothetical protein
MDELLSQNKYLNESNKYLKEEIEILKNSMKKLKTQYSNSNNNSNEISSISNLNSSLVDLKSINKKQLENLLKRAEHFLNNEGAMSSYQTNQQQLANAVYNATEIIAELKMLIEIALENLNDKQIANMHQRKVNKMLANRIQDLERELKLCFKNSNRHTVNPVDTSLNDSIETKLDEPLKPNPLEKNNNNYNNNNRDSNNNSAISLFIHN